MAPGSIEMNFNKINSSCLEGVTEMTKKKANSSIPILTDSRERNSYWRPSKIQLAQIEGA